MTGGRSLTIWDNEIPIAINTRLNRIKCMKFNFLSDSLYLGCNDSSVIVYFI